MSDQIAYVSSSCNATTSAAHWGKNGLICYASCNAVLIYNPNIGGGKIIQTLYKHRDRVNTVKWIANDVYETELISGSTDGTVIVWTMKESQYCATVLSGHESNVNSIDGLYLDDTKRDLMVATTSVDSTIKIWYRLSVDEEFSMSQVINLNYGLCLTLRLFRLPCGTILLASAQDDANIYLYVEDNEQVKNFSKSDVLKGHSDWVHSIDFTQQESEIYLASASQDTSIHLFKITPNTGKRAKYQIKTTKSEYNVHVESFIVGHEDWVYSVNWSSIHLKLLSGSMDKTLIIWEYDTSVNLWLETTRLGEVGGNTLGFYGALFGPDGDMILAYSYHGAFHMWKLDELNIWNPMVTVHGHFNAVVDIGWDPQGSFLLSVSQDQTTRLHAPWKTDDKSITWHEIARPQVHGYDMTALAILSRYKFISSGDEKVIRVFQAPENFVQNFCRICRVSDNEVGDVSDLPRGASVPSLGLSNKAVYENDNLAQATPKSSKEMYAEESYFTAIELLAPPTEETLVQNTLWPEIQKLYGHGYEIYSLAVSKDRKYLASACKSTTAEHASIILWDTLSWKQIQKLYAHTLTIAQMEFSPDSNHLLSVSRDRRWSLFTRDEISNDYKLAATTDKKTSIHTRIIWTCSWSHDSAYFVTGSREGKAVVWHKNEEKEPQKLIGKYESASQYLDLKDAITALCFAPIPIKENYLIAIGLESGIIYLYLWCKEWLRVSTYDNSVAHHLTVRKLSFRPVVGRAEYEDEEDNVLQLASCSNDHSVRIYEIHLNKL